VTLVARDRGGPDLKLQVLTYPAVDGTMSAPSIEENAEAPLLGRTQMAWFWEHYVPRGTDVRDPRLSPLHAEDLGKLPPAFISTAEFDPLRDEGEAYADKLKSAGVEVEVERYNGVFHGFMLMSNVIPEGRRLIGAQTEFIKRKFAQ
jgi:acetyl esterase